MTSPYRWGIRPAEWELESDRKQLESVRQHAEEFRRADQDIRGLISTPGHKAIDVGATNSFETSQLVVTDTPKGTLAVEGENLALAPLFSWAGIFHALNEHIGNNHFKNSESTRDNIRKLNRLRNGPIVFPVGKGKQPQADKTKMIGWWDEIKSNFDARNVEVESDAEAARIETADTHKYGRTGTVVPGIGGSVKLKRTPRKKGEEGKL